MFDVIERLKTEWTDKYVVVDSAAPELARFARSTGQVKTVNMNGRCLVEFDQYNNVGWYDIDPACLKVVPKPAPKPVETKEKSAKAEKPAKPAAKPAAAPAAAAKKPSTADILAVKSPMVGTFYRASGPDAAPFIKVGDRIGPDKTVCIIEAMKVFNEIPSGVSGQVVAILVENGHPVEFGQVLVKIDPEK